MPKNVRRTFSRRRPERAIQLRVVAELRLAGVHAFHCPNENQHRLTREGVEAGIPDLIIVTPPPAIPGSPGAVLELKAPGKKPTPAQRKWLATFALYGWATAWADSEEQALAVLRAWGYNVRTRPEQVPTLPKDPAAVP